jgi:hypothetical protein
VADANEDGNADGSDFLIWRRRTAAAYQPSGKNVPEPAAGELIAVGAIAIAISLAAARPPAVKDQPSAVQ